MSPSVLGFMLLLLSSCCWYVYVHNACGTIVVILFFCITSEFSLKSGYSVMSCDIFTPCSSSSLSRSEKMAVVQSRLLLKHIDLQIYCNAAPMTSTMTSEEWRSYVVNVVAVIHDASNTMEMHWTSMHNL